MDLEKCVGDLMQSDSIEVKAELLCKGVKINSNLIKEFTWKMLGQEEPTYSKRTGLAGIQILIGNNCRANTSFGDKFTKSSPYAIIIKDGTFVLTRNGNICQNIRLIPPPEWYFKKTSDNILMSSILVVEGSKTLIMSYRNYCDYYKIKKQCLFCALNYNRRRWKSGKSHLANIIETLNVALKYNPNYNFHLTGGNTLTKDKGLVNCIKYIQAIRQESNIPISVELAPPDTNNYLDTLSNVGCNSVVINLEIWDEGKRQEICPGKYQISKQRYFESWKYALDLFGENQVASVLIAGLEPKESIIEGAKQLIQIGVIPIIMPFRPIDGCGLEKHPLTSPTDVLYISKYVATLMKEKGLNPNLQPGCTSCGACSIDVDCLK